MNLNFWDGVMISGMFWLIISAVCLMLGFLAGDRNFPIDWSNGFTAGWDAAVETYDLAIYERMGGNMNI